MTHFESDLTASKGGSRLSGGGLAPYEIVILTGGLNMFSEGRIMPSEDGRAGYFRSTVFALEVVSPICCEAWYFWEGLIMPEYI